MFYKCSQEIDLYKGIINASYIIFPFLINP